MAAVDFRACPSPQKGPHVYMQVSLCPSPGPSSHLSFFFVCFFQTCYSGHFIWNESYNSRSSLSGFFHLECIWGSSMLQQELVGVPLLTKYSTMDNPTWSSSIPCLMGFWVASTLNTVAVNITPQMFEGMYAPTSLGHMHGSGISGSCCKFMLSF